MAEREQSSLPIFSLSSVLRRLSLQLGSMSSNAPPEEERPRSSPTDYGAFVLKAMAGMTLTSNAIDQRLLRYYIGLASSYLVMDSCTNREGGIQSWSVGFNRLIDVVAALHSRDELELETVNEASRACSECWSVASTWQGLDDIKETVRVIAGKLKTILDPNGITYRGQSVYTP